MHNRYTDNGTIFFKERGKEVAWGVQVNRYFGPGAPFAVIKWANWENEYMPFGFQETNEPPDMLGWEIASLADIILYGEKETVDKIEKIRDMVRLGYKGKFHTPDDIMTEIEWKMSQ